MPFTRQSVAILAVFGVLTAYLAVRAALPRKKRLFGCYVNYLWMFFLFFALAELGRFALGIWVLGLLCFWALREFFSLIDFRIEDRWGILGAYAAIPFMIYFIQIEWYGMFIVSIPVYAFLVVPFLVSLGGRESRGAVFSIGAIDFGLFLFVYCLGHVGYLASTSFNPWMAVMLIVNVLACDAAEAYLEYGRWKPRERWAAQYLLSAAVTINLSLVLARWTGIPVWHSVVLGALIPALVQMGNRTLGCVMADLGVSRENLAPGKGQIIASVRSVFWTAPVVFHYIRYFLT